ncbi:MAG: terpene cyclase/mutase family protein [Thermoplasmata archaeon]|nr:terpene cyclase/mutase family protein [Thermoplasmata archaeon]
MVEDSTEKLLRTAVPPVRYWANRFVLQLPDDSPEQRRALADCEDYPPRIRLLRLQSEDGTWPVGGARAAAELRGPGPPYGWTYTTMLRSLYELAECKTPRTAGHIGTSLELMLSWQADDGHIPGPSMVGIPEVNTNGFALSIFNRFGMADDPRVRRLKDWLMSMQRPDGGWNIPYVQDMRYEPEYRYMRSVVFEDLVRDRKAHGYDPSRYSDIPSCIWTTLSVLRGMVQNPETRFNPDVRKAGDFILDRFFKRNYHACHHRAESNWTTLKYPTYHGSGLVALEMLTAMGFGRSDPRMEKPIEWLVGARSSDGLWHTTERPNPDRDQWISVMAVSALARYRRQR